MARVPLYQPNQVDAVETTRARIRPADNDGGIGGAIGGGLQQLGKAGAQYAEVQDRLDFEFDDTLSRRAMVQYQQRSAEITAELENLQGLNAVSARGQTEAKLKELHDTLLGEAQSPRAKALTGDRLAGLFSADRIKVGNYAVKQATVERGKQFDAQISINGELAASNWQAPALRQQFIDTGVAAIRDRASWAGVSAEERSLDEAKFVSGVHKAVANNMLAGDDIDAAEAYLEANADQMLYGDELALRSDMKEPLQQREAAGDFVRAISGLADAPAEPGKGVTTEGAYAAPVRGTVTSDFAAHRRRGSSGVDIAAPIGSTIRPIAPGEVVSVSSDGRSGKFVVVRHGDGRTSSYSHMGGQAVKVGQTVTAEDTLGTVGMTGHTTGPHVHLRVKDANGQDVDPEKVMGTRASGVIGGGNEPRRWDKDQVYDQIETLAEKEGWTFERKERALARADKEIARDEQLIERKERDADRQAGEVVLGLGERFTSVNQIPAALRARMSPADLAQYGEIAERNRTPKEPVANGPTSTVLNLKRIQQPDAFINENLAKYQGQMTRAELDSLLQQQATMRVDAAKPKDQRAWSPREGINSAVTFGKRMGALKLDDNEEAAIVQIMEAEAQALYRTRGNKPLGPGDYDDLWRSATRNVKTRGFFGGAGEKPRYGLTEGNMPDSVRREITTRFKNEMGREPTDDELLRLYRVRTRR